jgi:hypothetical protein
MSPRRALALLLVLLVVAFAASFAVARALRGEPKPASPPRTVEVPSLHLAELGPPAELPPLRPAPRASRPAASPG